MLSDVWNGGFLLGALVKLRKSNYNLLHDMSVCLSIPPYETPQLLLEGFSSNFDIKNNSQKFVEKWKFDENPDKNNRHFTWRPIYICRAHWGKGLIFHQAKPRCTREGGGLVWGWRIFRSSVLDLDLEANMSSWFLIFFFLFFFES